MRAACRAALSRLWMASRSSPVIAACRDACLERRVSVRKGGVKVEQVQYYHRAVACQIISSPVKAVLAVEWLQPGESEDTAALRLLHSCRRSTAAVLSGTAENCRN